MVETKSQAPLPCPQCDATGIEPGAGLRAHSEGFDGECASCCGTGVASCQGCDEHPRDAPAVRECDGERYCAACARQFDADAAEYADCQAGHVAARTTEAGWLALSKHETKYFEPFDDGGPRLAMRTCSHCRTSLTREVDAAEGRAA